MPDKMIVDADIIDKAHNGEIDIPRKVCKALWLVAGKKKETFDMEIWPVP